MREDLPPTNTDLPPYLLQNTDGQFIQLLFNSLRSSVLYLDQWGRICSANIRAQQLFNEEDLVGKTLLEFLSGWDKPIHCHHEVLQVARTGVSILDATQRVVINGEVNWYRTDKAAVKDEFDNISGVLMTLDDITTLKNHEISLAQSESHYRAFVENSQDAIWRFDLDPPVPVDWPNEAMIKAITKRAILGDCNSIFAKTYGFEDTKQALGLHLEDDAAAYIMNVTDFVESQFRASKQEIVWGDKQDNQLCLQVSANGTIKEGTLVEVWGVTRDITERRRHIDRLEYQTTHDMLTGLPNRISLKTVVEDMIVTQSEDSFALLLIDLDRFKEINDTLGHHVGDNLIKEIGPRIQQQLKHLKATVARLGGDEFAILLPDIPSQEFARLTAEQVVHCIRKDFHIDDMSIELRASLGISIYPDQAEDFATLMRYADVAMYAAKRSIASVEVYNPDTDMNSPKRLSLMNDLSKAIRGDQLTLYYQPKINLETKEVVGVEALSRWIHPVLGFVSPAEFIPIAETTDMINEITDWVLLASLRQISEWKKQGLNLKVAVNVSARNLLNDNLQQKIEWLLHRYRLSPGCLELEITESSIMNNADRTLKILEGINDLGIDLYIDDFGTGYSSLAYLKRLPVKWLKIDYAFIVNILEDEQDQIIVNSTIKMAHNLGLKVVAEGVEDDRVLDCLCAMDCEQAQGFYIAKPMPAEKFGDWYTDYQQKLG